MKAGTTITRYLSVCSADDKTTAEDVFNHALLLPVKHPPSTPYITVEIKVIREEPKYSHQR